MYAKFCEFLLKNANHLTLKIEHIVANFFARQFIINIDRSLLVILITIINYNKRIQLIITYLITRA